MDKETITTIARVTNASYLDGIKKGRIEVYKELISYLDGHYEGKTTAAILKLKQEIKEWIKNEK